MAVTGSSAWRIGAGLLGLLGVACGGRSTGWTDGFGSSGEQTHPRLYVASYASRDIRGYEIGESGELTELPGSGLNHS